MAKNYWRADNELGSDSHGLSCLDRLKKNVKNFSHDKVSAQADFNWTFPECMLPTELTCLADDTYQSNTCSQYETC